MSQQIIDGTGQGYRAKVDENKRLYTRAVSSTDREASGLSGDTYNVNTGTITLTDSSESAILYFKNNNGNNYIIDVIGYLLGNSSGGSGDILAKVIKNPTGGTIISDAANVDIEANKNFGSQRVLTADAFKGGQGKTITGGSEAYNSLLPAAARSYAINTGNIVLEPQSSMAITLTPQSGNTSMDLQVFLSVIDYRL